MQQLDNLAEYTGKPCMYIRWIEAVEASYIGSTVNLYQRYGVSELYQVYFFAEYTTIAKARTAERLTIREFLASKLPLTNRMIPQRLSRRDKIPQVSRNWRDCKQIILEYMQRHEHTSPRGGVRPLEVAKALSMSPDTARSTMKRMAEQGELMKEFYGIYSLPDVS